MMNILFVCEGNTCRSPMATALFKKYLDENFLNNIYSSSSAGISAFVGETANEKAITVMQELGIDISSHRSAKLSAELIEQSDFVFVMNDYMKDIIADSFSEIESKIYVLGNSIEDPYGLDINKYRECRDMLDDCIKKIFDNLG